MKKIFLLFMIMCVSGVSQGVLAATETAIMQQIARGNYRDAYFMAKSGSDAFTRNLAHWYYLLRSDEIAPHSEYEQFLLKNPYAPEAKALAARAEIAFLNTHPTSRQMHVWFHVHPPISSRARLLLMHAEGKMDTKQLNNLWINADLSANEEHLIEKTYAKQLTRQSYAARLSRLQWDGLNRAAERLLPYVSKEQAAVARARHAIATHAPNMEVLLSRVPSSHRRDAGLLYERIRFRANAGNYEGVKELLVQAKAPLPYPEKWLPYQLRTMRDAIENKDYRTAKIVADNHSQKDAIGVVEAEWMRGWLYMEFLKQPQVAVRAFEAIYRTAIMPISRARGAYFAARAYDQMGNAAKAKEWYRTAALFPTTFFGQLAHQHILPNTPLPLPALIPPAAQELEQFKRSDALAAGLERYIRAGYGGLVWNHVKARLERETNPSTFARLAAVARTAGDNPLAIKIAQEAANKGIYLKELFPTPSLPKGLKIDPAFALAIARQESRFDARATSPADARGLMQILPSTGRAVAQKMGLGFTPTRLYEAQYNATLGSSYMRGLLDRFAGRAVLAICGYNAGPARPHSWEARFGGVARRNVAQMVQWIEMIPFGETRNYVQRVLENYHVYRHILHNGSIALSAEQTLTQPMK
jgi:soluble lytic murein transglycosylase